jgi:hypothetical protein
MAFIDDLAANVEILLKNFSFVAFVSLSTSMEEYFDLRINLAVAIPLASIKL